MARNAAQFKGKVLSANLPYVVQFLDPVKFSAHLVGVPNQLLVSSLSSVLIRSHNTGSRFFPILCCGTICSVRICYSAVRAQVLCMHAPRTEGVVSLGVGCRELCPMQGPKLGAFRPGRAHSRGSADSRVSCSRPSFEAITPQHQTKL